MPCSRASGSWSQAQSASTGEQWIACCSCCRRRDCAAGRRGCCSSDGRPCKFVAVLSASAGLCNAAALWAAPALAVTGQEQAAALLLVEVLVEVLMLMLLVLVLPARLVQQSCTLQPQLLSGMGSNPHIPHVHAFLALHRSACICDPT